MGRVQDYPSVYERLKAKVASGQFLPVGGTWVEMVRGPLFRLLLAPSHTTI
jgi:hypothetical protein